MIEKLYNSFNESTRTKRSSAAKILNVIAHMILVYFKVHLVIVYSM